MLRSLEVHVSRLTVRVDDWEDIKVVLVDKSLDLRVGGIVGEQIVAQVLDGLDTLNVRT